MSWFGGWGEDEENNKKDGEQQQQQQQEDEVKDKEPEEANPDEQEEQEEVEVTTTEVIEKREEGSWFGWLDGDDNEEEKKKKELKDRLTTEQDIRKLLEAEATDEDTEAREATAAILKAMFKSDDIARVREQIKQEQLLLLGTVGEEEGEGNGEDDTKQSADNDAEIKRLLESGMAVKVVEQMHGPADVQRINLALNPDAGKKEAGEVKDDLAVAAASRAPPAQQQSTSQSDDPINQGLSPELIKGNASEFVTADPDQDLLYGDRDPPEPPPADEDPKKRDKDRKKFIPKAERLKTLEATVDEQDIQLQKTLVEMEVMNCERRALERQMQFQDDELVDILEALEHENKYTPKSVPITDSLDHTKDLLIADLKQQLKTALSTAGNGSGTDIATSASIERATGDGPTTGVGVGADPAKIAELEKKLADAKDSHLNEKSTLMEKVNALKVSSASLKSQLKERSKQLETLRGEAGPEMERLLKVEQEASDTRNDLETRLTASETEANDLRQTVSHLEDENRLLQEEKENLQHANTDLEEKVTSLESSQQELQTAKESATAALGGLRTEFVDVEARYTEELEASKASLLDANEKITALELNKTELNEVRTKLADVESQHTEELEASKASLQEANEKLTAAESKNAELDEIRTKLADTESQHTEELEASKASLQEANEKLTASESKNAELLASNEAEASKLQETSSKQGNLEVLLQNLQTAKTTLETQLQAAEEKIVALKGDEDELESAQMLLSDTNEKLAILESTISDLQTSKDSLEQQLQEAKQEANDRIAEIENNGKDQLEATQESLVEAEAKADSLETQMTELETSFDSELSALQSSKFSLQHKLESAEAKVAALEASAWQEAQSVQDTLTEATDKLTASDAAKEEIKASKVSLEEDLQHSTVKVSELESQLVELQTFQIETEKELQEATAQLSNLDSEVTELQTTRSSLIEVTDKVSSLESELSELQDTREALTDASDKVSKLETDITELTATKDGLEEQLAAATKRVAVVEGELVESRQAHQEALDERETLEEILEEADTAAKRQREEATEMGKATKLLQDESATLQDELTTLRDSIADGEGQTQEFIASLKGDLESSQLEHKEATAARELLESELVEAQVESVRLQEALLEIQIKLEEKEKIANEVTVLQASAEALELNWTLASEKILTLEADLRQSEEECFAAANAKVNIEASMNEASSAAEALLKKITSLETNNALLLEQKNTAEEEISQLKTMSIDLEGQIEKANATIVEVAADLKMSQEEHSQTARDLEETGKLHSEKRESMTAELEQFKSFSQEHYGQMAEANERTTALEKELEKTRTNLRDTVLAKEDLESYLAEKEASLEKLQSEVELILTEKDIAAETHQSRALELESSDGNRQRVQEEVSLLKASFASIELECSTSKEKVASLEEELEQTKQEVLDANANLEAKEALNLSNLEQAHQTLQHEKTAREQEVATASAQMADASKRASALEDELEQTRISMTLTDQLKEDFESNLAEKEASLARLQSEFEALLAARDTVVKNHQSTVLELESSNESKQQLQEEMSLLKVALATVELERNTNKEKVASLEEELEQVKKEVLDANDVNENLVSSLQDIESTKKNMEVEVSNLQQANQTLQDEKAASAEEVVTLSAQMEENTKKATALDEELEQTRKNMIATVKATEDLGSTLAEKEVSLANLRLEFELLLAEKDTATETHQSRALELESSNKSKQQEKAIIQEEVSLLKASFAAVELECTASKEKVVFLEEELAQAKHQVLVVNEAKENLVSTLKDAGSTKEAMQVELSTLQQTNQTLEVKETASQQEVATLKSSLEASISERLASMEDELNQTKLDAESIKVATAKVEQAKQVLENEKGAMEIERKSLVEEVLNVTTLLDGKEAALGAANEKLLELEEGLAKATLDAEKNSNLEEQLAQAMVGAGMVSALEEELEQVKQNTAAIEGSMENVEQAKQTLEEEKGALEVEKQALVQDLLSKEEVLSEAKKAAEEANAAKMSLETNLRDAGSTKDALQLQISKLEETNQGLRIESDLLFQQVTQLEKSLGEQEGVLNAQTESIAGLEKDLDQARGETVELVASKELAEKATKEATAEANEGLRSLTQQEDTWGKAMGNLQEELDDAREKLAELESAKQGMVDNAKVEVKEALQALAQQEDAWGKAMVTLQGELNDAREKFALLEKELDYERQEKLSMEKGLKQVQAEKESLSEQVVSLDEKINDLEEKIRSVEDDLDAAQREARESSADVEDENTLLRKAVGDAKTLLTHSNDKIVELMEGRGSLLSSLQQSESTVSQLEGDLLIIKSQQDSLLSQLKDARNERETFTSRSICKDNQHAGELEAVQSERDHFKDQLEKQSGDQEPSHSTLETLRNEISDLEGRAVTELEEKHGLQQQLEDVKANFATTKDIFIANASESLEKAKTENDQLEERHELLDHELQTALAENAVLELKLDKAELAQNKESEQREFSKVERSALVSQIVELEQNLQRASGDSSVADLDDEDDSKPNESSDRDLLANVAARLKMTEPDGTVRSVCSDSSFEEERNRERQSRANTPKPKEDTKEELLEENEALRETIIDLEIQMVALDAQLDALIRHFPSIYHGRKEESDNTEGDSNGLLPKLTRVEQTMEEYTTSLKETSERLEAIVSEKITLERNMESVAQSLERSLAKENTLEQLLDEANETIANLADHGLGEVDESQNRLSGFEMEKKMVTARLEDLQHDLQKKLNEPEDTLASEESLAKELHTASQRLQELDVLIHHEVEGSLSPVPDSDCGSEESESDAGGEGEVDNGLRNEMLRLKETIAERERRIEDLSKALDAAVAETYSIEEAADDARREMALLRSSISDLTPAAAAPPTSNRYQQDDDNSESESLKTKITELEETIQTEKEKMDSVQERLDSVQKEKFALDSQVDILLEEKQRSSEFQSQLESSLKSSQSNVEVYSNAVGELEVVLQNTTDQSNNTPTFFSNNNSNNNNKPKDTSNSNTEDSLMKRIHALSTIISQMQTFDATTLTDTQQELEAARAEKDRLVATMEQSSQKTVVLMSEAGQKLKSLEGQLRTTETERDDNYEQAVTLHRLVIKMEEDKENEIHLLNMVMDQLIELDIDMPNLRG